MGLIPGSERSAGEGNGNPIQYSCLENPMDRGVWWATVHGVTRVRHDLVTKPPNQVSKSLKLSYYKLMVAIREVCQTVYRCMCVYCMYANILLKDTF